MTNQDERPDRWVDDILYFFSWVVSSVLVGANFLLARGLVQAIMARIGAALSPEHLAQRREMYAAPYDRVAYAVVQVATLVLACISLAVVIYIERYLDRGVTEGRILERIRRTFIILLASGVLLYGSTLLLYSL